MNILNLLNKKDNAITYGFTGTRDGLSQKQKDDIIELFKSTLVRETHHGDCEGADSNFHSICELFNLKIIIHPPTDEKLRARCNGIILHAKPYLERNKDIVNASDILIACPRSHVEELRSGTWSTIRYARKMNKKVVIIV